MSVEIITGNIFTSKCQTIVNTINCVGVMGAGIALECRLRYPEMFEKYVIHCKNGELAPGILWLYKADDRWILNFPTKADWKAPSKVGYLHAGLEKFVESYEKKGIESIAFPLLGADKGGIPKEESQAIILQHLDLLNIRIELYHYDPNASDDLFADFQNWYVSGGDVILREQHKISKNILTKISEAFTSHEVKQLNQLGSIKGVGVKSLEKIFRVAQSDLAPSKVQASLDF